MKYIKKFELKEYKNPDRIFLKAIDNDNIKLVEDFLKSGINLNRDYYELYHGTTSPLFKAIDIGNVRITKLLLKYGADPNYQPYACTHIILLAAMRRLEFIKILLETDIDWDLLGTNGKQRFCEMLHDDELEWLEENYSETFNDFFVNKNMNKYNL